MTNELKAAFGEDPSRESLYEDDGWWSDLGQVRAPMITFILAAVFFAATLLIYYSPISNKPAGSYRGISSTPTTAVGGLVSLLAFVVSIIGIGVGIFVASENRHRVRRLALVFATLSAINLVGFLVFAGMTASLTK